MNTSFEYVFPSIRGIQANREYYVSMCPLRLLPKIFLFDEEELVPELRAQRTLNKNRLPEMARYILDNKDGYVFSAITASIDGEVRFEALSEEGDGNRIGLLHVPMSVQFIINDGQHRRAAIELALRENPDLADETIAVVFFLDIGLERCQQMFADLNRYAVRPSRSLGLLYDHRDERVKLTKLMIARSDLFKNFVETERSTLSMRSRKLFTLSAVHTANKALIEDLEMDFEEKIALAIAFWEEVANYMHEWGLVRQAKLTAGEVRQGFIHSHAIALHSLGKLGNSLLKKRSKGWKQTLKKLTSINWSRSNATDWEGRAMIGGRVSKSFQNVTLTTNLLKQHLNIPLTPEEQRVEDAFLRGDHG
jgi:DNA sulfur modification protein DndB